MFWQRLQKVIKNKNQSAISTNLGSIFIFFFFFYFIMFVCLFCYTFFFSKITFNKGRFLFDQREIERERGNDKRIIIINVMYFIFVFVQLFCAGLFSNIQGIHTLIALWPYCRYILHQHHKIFNFFFQVTANVEKKEQIDYIIRILTKSIILLFCFGISKIMFVIT